MKLIENPYRSNSYVAPLGHAITNVRIAPVGFARALLLGGAMVFVPAAATTTTGCGATNAQIQDTILAGEQLATCVIATVLAGVTDPLQIIGRCAGAVPAVIADVIADFETKQIAVQSSLASDAGSAPPEGDTTLRGLSLRKLSDRETLLLSTAKKNAALAVAAAHKSP